MTNPFDDPSPSQGTKGSFTVENAGDPNSFGDGPADASAGYVTSNFHAQDKSSVGTLIPMSPPAEQPSFSDSKNPENLEPAYGRSVGRSQHATASEPETLRPDHDHDFYPPGYSSGMRGQSLSQGIRLDVPSLEREPTWGPASHRFSIGSSSPRTSRVIRPPHRGARHRTLSCCLPWDRERVAIFAVASGITCLLVSACVVAADVSVRSETTDVLAQILQAATRGCPTAPGLPNTDSAVLDEVESALSRSCVDPNTTALEGLCGELTSIVSKRPSRSSFKRSASSLADDYSTPKGRAGGNRRSLADVD